MSAALWWDPRVRENLPGPPYAYPRFATRPLGEALPLGLGVAQNSNPLKVQRLGLILTENIPHDFIDPLQPDARTEKINTLLVEWLTR